MRALNIQRFTAQKRRERCQIGQRQVGFHLVKQRHGQLQQVEKLHLHQLLRRAPEDPLLPAGSLKIAVDLADAAVAQGLPAVEQMLARGFQQAVVRRKAHLAVIILQNFVELLTLGLGDLRLHAAQQVHSLHQRGKARRDGMLGADAEVFLQRLEKQLLAAIEVGRVEPVLAVPGDGDVQVAQERNQPDAARLDRCSPASSHRCGRPFPMCPRR